MCIHVLQWRHLIMHLSIALHLGVMVFRTTGSAILSVTVTMTRWEISHRDHVAPTMKGDFIGVFIDKNETCRCKLAVSKNG